jgi:hypothetical protein
MIEVSADSTDIFFKVAERGLYLPMKAGTFQPSGHKALIRQHGEGVKILNVVKNSYKLVTHREVYDALTPILNEHDVTVSTYHDNDGAKAYIDVRFNGLTTSLAGSKVAFRAIFVNGYGGTSFGCKVGAINFFCTNGMITGEHDVVYRRHTSGLDASIAALYQTLTDFASHFEEYKLRAVNNNSPHELEFTLLAKAERVMARLAA